MRVATIDIGTNSVLLLIADVVADGVRPVCERATVTRLGRGVDATGQLDADAAERTLEALRTFAREVVAAGAERTAAVATSALRDVAASRAFLDRIEAVLGARPRIISGAEEAQLTFDGALQGLPLSDGAVAMFDVGGGSTEIMIGHVDAACHAGLDEAISLDVGCVRLTERLVASDPPRERELESVRAALRGELQRAPVLAGRPLVGVGGTVTTLAALIERVDPYDGARVHGTPLTRGAIQQAIERLAALPLTDRRGEPGLEPARADVIVTGATLVDELLSYAGTDRLIVSDRGLRWGLARQLARP